ncbi:MAG: hypothetical protein GXX96_00425 [Planctomycetaceae bacterium]|nr:hypothetical protein [Planctomycetaceae bacterium]
MVVDRVLFTITCTTCEARLNVRDPSIVGAIVNCPKCESMVQITPPPGWQTPSFAEPVQKKPKEPAPAPPQAQVKKTQARRIADAAAAGIAASAATAAGSEPPPAASPPPLEGLPKQPPEAKGFPELEAPPIQQPAEIVTPEAIPPLPPTQWVAPAEAATRRWLLWGSVSAASAVVLLGAWVLFFSSNDSEPRPNDDPQVSESPRSDTGQPVPSPATEIDDRWIPDSPQLVIRIEIAGAEAAGQLGPLMKAVPPLNRAIMAELFQGFGLQPNAVQRVLWSTADLSAWSETGIVVVTLAEGQSTGSLRSAGTSTGQQAGEIEIRQLDRPAWPRAFAVLDERTFVTGEEGNLRQLAERGQRRAKLGVLEALLKETTPDADFSVALELRAAEQAGWPMPSEWFDTWPQGRDAWHLIWSLPSAVSFCFDRDDLALAELGFLCEGETVADKVRVALEQWIPQAKSAIASRIEGLPDSIKAGEIPGDSADAYRLALDGAAAALASSHLEAAGRCVWLRADFGDNSSAWTAAAVESRAAIRADWHRAGLHGALTEHNQAEQPVRVEPQPAPPSDTIPPDDKTPADEIPAPSVSEEPVAQSETTPENVLDISERLQKPLPGIVMTNVPLNQAIRAVERFGSLLVTTDVDTMSALGVPLDRPVSQHLTESTVGAALDRILASCGLKPVVRDDQVWVTGAGQVSELPRTVSYSVTDLMVPGITSASDLAAWLPRLIAPATWQAAGDQGTVQVKDQALEITQTEAVHLEVLVFCERLRVSRGLSPRSGRPAAQFPVATRRDRAASRLSAPVSVNFFRPASIDRILGELEQRSELLIAVNWLALAKEGKSPDLPTTFSVAQVPLSEALERLLTPLELDYRVIDERTVEVTTRAAADAHFEREFYPVADLLNADLTAATLIARLCGEVEAGGWRAGGGSGDVVFDEPSRCLIVFHTQRAHAAVERWLDDLRAERKAASGKAKD